MINQKKNKYAIINIQSTYATYKDNQIEMACKNFLNNFSVSLSHEIANDNVKILSLHTYNIKKPANIFKFSNEEYKLIYLDIY